MANRKGWKNMARQNEKGQSMVVVVLFTMFAFIAITALAIDGGTLYLARRDLLNNSDAACLAAAVELAQGGNAAAAENAAQDYILLNGGETSWYSPSAGSGIGLVRGIEISGVDVRVALQRDVPTVFTRLLGQPPTLVGGRSRCNESGGGLLPIAIKRYGEDPDITSNLGGGCVDGAFDVCNNPPGPDGLMDDVDCTNNNPPPGYSCDTNFGLDQGNDGQGNVPSIQHRVVDYTQSAGADVLTWWPQNGSDSTSPADPQCLLLPPYNTGCPADPVVNLGDTPGRAMYLVGDGAFANVAQGEDFRFFVTLDVRCITCGANRWYNQAFGVQPASSVQSLKNTSMFWICGGYLGEIPLPGQQVGVLSGADANQAAGEIGACYQPGDVVAVVVYNGTVYRDPAFTISVAPDTQNTTWDDKNNDGDAYKPNGQPDEDEITGPAVPCPDRGSDSGILFSNCAQYTLTLTPDTHFKSTGVELTVYTSDPLYWSGALTVSPLTSIVASWEKPDADKDGIEDTVKPRKTVSVSASTSVSRNFYVWQRGFVPTAMARTLFIDAYDPSTQVHHLTTARIQVGTTQTHDFAMSLGDDPFLLVKRPQSGTQTLNWTVEYQDLGSSPPNGSEPLLIWCGQDRTGQACPTPEPKGVEVDWKKSGSKWELTIRVNPSADIARHTFKIVSPGGSLNTPQGHFAVGGFDVVAESAGESAQSLNSFVEILGYAKMRILAIDANSVVAQVVDAEVSTGEVAASFVPRLLPWE